MWQSAGALSSQRAVPFILNFFINFPAACCDSHNLAHSLQPVRSLSFYGSWISARLAARPQPVLLQFTQPGIELLALAPNLFSLPIIHLLSSDYSPNLKSETVTTDLHCADWRSTSRDDLVLLAIRYLIRRIILTSRRRFPPAIHLLTPPFRPSVRRDPHHGLRLLLRLRI